jgi:hypothetical protein
MMDLSQQKEQFSFAYVRAVAAAAGFGVSEPSVDDDSIDLMIASRSTTGTVKRPRLELQVKCTEGEALADESFSYPLKIKNYDDLRDPDVLVPRVLVVVKVPAEVDQWAASSDEELILRRCGYWASLRGMDATENKATVSISVRREDRFTVDGLRAMMQRIEQKEQP